MPGIDRCEERSEDGHARRLQVQRHAPAWAVAALVAPVRDVLRVRVWLGLLLLAEKEFFERTTADVVQISSPCVTITPAVT